MKIHEDVNIECFNPDHWIWQKILPILDYKNSSVRQSFQILWPFKVFKDNCPKSRNVTLVKIHGARKKNTVSEISSLTPCTPRPWQRHENVLDQGIFVIYTYYHHKIFFFFEKNCPINSVVVEALNKRLLWSNQAALS